MNESSTSLRLAAAQAAPVFLDRDATVEKACRIIDEAGANGADLIGFPEGFLPAHPVWYYHHTVGAPRSFEFATRLFENSVEIPSEATKTLAAAARRANVNVVMGLCERRPGTTGTMFNTQLFISRDGELLGKRQKLVPTVGERQVHAAGSGDGVRTFATDFGPVGGLICGENSNPLAIYRLLSEHILVHVASWPHYFLPTWPSGMANTATLTGRSTAYMAKCFVINACGTIDDEMREVLPANEEERRYLDDPSHFGGSTIIGPSGDILAGPAGPHDEIIYADVDPADVVRAKLVHDFGGHYQRHDVFELQVHGSAPHTPVQLPEPEPVRAARPRPQAADERRREPLMLETSGIATAGEVSDDPGATDDEPRRRRWLSRSSGDDA